ncbi:MAG: hypothetical protein OXC62_13320 [Aestuariivita sp.]|nr:hypothetical protein [Aestuariivita sp.]
MIQILTTTVFKRRPERNTLMTVMPQETDLGNSKTPPGVDLSPEQRLA